jgi:hypothetical protein
VSVFALNGSHTTTRTTWGPSDSESIGKGKPTDSDSEPCSTAEIRVRLESLNVQLHDCSCMADEDDDDAGRTALKLEMTYFNLNDGKMGLVTEVGGKGDRWGRARGGMFRVRMFGFAKFLTLHCRNLKRLPDTRFPSALADSYTALHKAAEGGHLPVVQALMGSYFVSARTNKRHHQQQRGGRHQRQRANLRVSERTIKRHHHHHHDENGYDYEHRRHRCTRLPREGIFRWFKSS